MPEGVIAEVVDGFATLDFVDASLRGPALARLLAIGGPGSIETLTREGPRRKYRVPEGNASEAGLVDDSASTVPRGDSGYTEALVQAHQAQAEEGNRPPTPTSAGNVFVGTTSFREAREGEHVASTMSGGSGYGVTHPPPHADLIARVRGPLEVDTSAEIPRGRPSNKWTRDQLEAYARREGIDTSELSDKPAVLDAVRNH